MPAPVLQFKRGNAGVAGTVPALRPGEPAISLNNFDFFIGIDTSVSNNKFFGSHRYWGREDGTTSLKLKLVDKDGTNGIHLKSPNALAGIGTYTLPSTNTIIDGYFLKVASDGTLSWDTIGGTNGTFVNPSLSGLTTVTGTFDNNANSDFSGITTFSNTTDNILGNPDTGAVQIDGGLGVNKNVTVGAGLSVVGQSYFIGTATFYGGQLNLGDTDTDNINVAGEFISNLVPNTTNTYDLGLTGKRWRDGYFGGNLDVTGNLTVDGLVTVGGGTTVILYGQDVYIKNKDIILGYTTSLTNEDASNDDTANHAGVAIASTVGSPLCSFSATGINTLPDTYKQLMWFHSGTLGFSTDAFAFNYGVAIGTTTMADGVRLAVGSGITMSDNSITVGTGVGITQFSNSVSAGNSTSSVPTSSAIIDYISAADIGLAGDSGTGSVNTSQTLTIIGTANEVNTSASGQTITVGLPDDVIVGTSLSAPTIRTNIIKSQNSGLTVLTLSGNSATVANDLTVNGNLYVEGSTTQVNTTTLTVEDRTIELGKIASALTQPTTTTWDLAVLFNYGDAGTAKKSGLVWEASGATKRFQFTNNINPGSDGSDSQTNLPQFTVTDFAPIEIGALWVSDCAGTSQVISCTGTERFLENITVDAGTF